MIYETLARWPISSSHGMVHGVVDQTCYTAYAYQTTISCFLAVKATKKIYSFSDPPEWNGITR